MKIFFLFLICSFFSPLTHSATQFRSKGFILLNGKSLTVEVICAMNDGKNNYVKIDHERFDIVQGCDSINAFSDKSQKTLLLYHLPEHLHQARENLHDLELANQREVKNFEQANSFLIIADSLNHEAIANFLELK